jgi:alkaline phosphatase D
VQRREFLAGLGAVASAPAGLRGEPRPSDAFAHGVASADPRPDSVVIWTRSQGTAELSWGVWLDPAREQVVAEGTTRSGPERDWTFHVDVTDLEPATTYYYAFIRDQVAVSPVGRARTAPKAAADRLRVGVVSCSRYATAGFAAYRALAEREVDVVLHLGDYIYEDGAAGARVHDPPERCTTLEHYRRRYAQHRLDPDLQLLHQRHTVAAIWDDHEVAGNAWREGARDHDDARDGAWAERRAAAVQAHSEWVPMRRDDPARIWRSLDLGALGELVLLDTRLQRDRQVTESDLEQLDDVARTMLGEEQLAFLSDRSTKADGAWLLIASSVMFSELRVPVPIPALADAVRQRGFVVDEGVALNPDQWDGYPREREVVRALVRGRQGGVVVLSGDVHSSWAFTEGDLVEMVTPSVSSASLGEVSGISSAAFRSVIPNEGLRYLDADAHGYLLIDLTPKRCVGEWWYVERDDASTERFGAAFTTEPVAPMSLEARTEPTDDPPPTTAPPATKPTTVPAQKEDGGGLPLAPVALGTAALAAIAGSIAIRRRRAE